MDGEPVTARSHADRGQLFGWDGANMWVEQTLDTAADGRPACRKHDRYKFQSDGGQWVCAACSVTVTK